MRDPSTTHGRAITSFYVARRQCVKFGTLLRWSVSFTFRLFYPSNRIKYTLRKGGWVAPKSVSTLLRRQKILPVSRFEARSSRYRHYNRLVITQASLCSDWAVYTTPAVVQHNILVFCFDSGNKSQCFLKLHYWTHLVITMMCVSWKPGVNFFFSWSNINFLPFPILKVKFSRYRPIWPRV
jgi:hypothetical protein